jgi:hypothetical protein
MYFNTENYLKGFYLRNKIIIDKVDRLISINLSYREKRKLICLIRSYNIRSKETVKNINSLLYVKINSDYRKHLENAAEIIQLYEKAGLIETECEIPVQVFEAENGEKYQLKLVMNLI